MNRSVPEWIGDTDDTAIPARVKLRVFERYGRRCAICTLVIRGSLMPTFDHTLALANGGENREGNLSLLCMPCHKGKSREDMAQKKIDYRVRAKQIGVNKAKGRPMPGTKRSGWKSKIGGGWERR